MARVLLGPEKHPNLFIPRQIGQFASLNTVKYTAWSISNFNNRFRSLTERLACRKHSEPGFKVGVRV
jgi:hypothetical protein